MSCPPYILTSVVPTSDGASGAPTSQGAPAVIPDDASVHDMLRLVLAKYDPITASTNKAIKANADTIKTLAEQQKDNMVSTNGTVATLTATTKGKVEVLEDSTATTQGDVLILQDDMTTTNGKVEVLQEDLETAKENQVQNINDTQLASQNITELERRLRQSEDITRELLANHRTLLLKQRALKGLMTKQRNMAKRNSQLTKKKPDGGERVDYSDVDKSAYPIYTPYMIAEDRMCQRCDDNHDAGGIGRCGEHLKKKYFQNKTIGDRIGDPIG